MTSRRLPGTHSAIETSVYVHTMVPTWSQFDCAPAPERGVEAITSLRDVVFGAPSPVRTSIPSAISRARFSAAADCSRAARFSARSSATRARTCVWIRDSACLFEASQETTPASLASRVRPRDAMLNAGGTSTGRNRRYPSENGHRPQRGRSTGPGSIRSTRTLCRPTD